MFNTLGNSIPRNGLVGEWLFDGNTLDTAGTNNGTPTNVLFVKTDKGYQSQAGSFNGSSSYMSTSTSSNNFGTGDFSINIWYYPIGTSTGQSQWIYSKNNNTSAGIRIGRDNFDRIVFFFVNGGGSIACNASYTEIGKWQMFTFTRQGTSIKVLKNGIEIGSSTISSGYNASTSTNGYFGVNYNGTAGFLNGYLQSTRFFNKLLSQDEIQLLYLEGLRKLGPINIAKYPSLLSGLVGYWDMKGTAHNLVDGVAGTVTGATLTTDRFGNSNSAYSFNGTSDNIDLGNNYSITGDIYIETYIYATKNTFYEGIVAKSQGATNTPYELRFNSNDSSYSLCFLRAGTDYWFWNTGNLSSLLANKWAHIVVTNTGSTCKIYVNGVEQSVTLNRTVGTPTTTTNATKIGAVISGQYFGGTIDFVRIGNKYLSSDEVKLLYDLTSQDYIYPTPSYDIASLRDGLKLNYDLSYNGTTYYDDSGNGYNFTGTNITNIRQGKSKIVGLLTANSGSNIRSTTNLGYTNTSSLTINKWVKTGYAGTYGTICGFYVPSPHNFGYFIMAHNGTYQLNAVRPGTADQFLNSGYSVSSTKWNMVTGVFNNGSFKIYIDGVLFASSTYSTSIGSFPQTASVELYKCDGSGHTNYQGHTRIISGGLSDKEIQSLYYSQKANFVY